MPLLYNKIFYTRNIRKKSYHFSRATIVLGRTYYMTHATKEKIDCIALFMVVMFAPVGALALTV